MPGHPTGTCIWRDKRKLTWPNSSSSASSCRGDRQAITSSIVRLSSASQYACRVGARALAPLLLGRGEHGLITKHSLPALVSSSRGPRSGSTSKVAARKKAAAKAPPTPPSPTSEGRKKYSTPAAPADMREPLVRPPAGLGRKSFSSTPVGLDPASLLGLSTAPGTEGGGGGHLQQYFPVRPARRRKDDNLMEESDEEDTRDLEELIRIKERSLVGSLTNSYAFKEGGLVKRVSEALPLTDSCGGTLTAARAPSNRRCRCLSAAKRSTSSRTTLSLPA